MPLDLQTLSDAREFAQETLRPFLFENLALVLPEERYAQNEADFFAALNARIAATPTPNRNAVRYAAVECILQFVDKKRRALLDMDDDAERKALVLIEKIIESDECLDLDSSLLLAVDEKGNSLLMKAVDSECESIAEFLLRKGSDPNQRCQSNGHRARYREPGLERPGENAALLALRLGFSPQFLVKLLTPENVAEVLDVANKTLDCTNVRDYAMSIGLGRIAIYTFVRIAQCAATARVIHAMALMPYTAKLRRHHAARDLLFSAPPIRSFEDDARRKVLELVVSQYRHIFDLLEVMCLYLAVDDRAKHLPKLFGEGYLADFVVELYTLHTAFAAKQGCDILELKDDELDILQEQFVTQHQGRAAGVQSQPADEPREAVETYESFGEALLRMG